MKKGFTVLELLLALIAAGGAMAVTARILLMILLGNGNGIHMNNGGNIQTNIVYDTNRR